MIFDKDQFSSDLKARRTERGLSQQAAAEEARVSQNTFHRMENGYGTPDSPTYALLCAWLGVPMATYMHVDAAVAPTRIPEAA